MSEKAHFKVDTRLAALLGENYRSTEYALKELIDNAWDADALTVKITLPEPLTGDPIIIEDDGLGMTAAELKEGYLKIASDRKSRKGDRSLKFGRKVKGRKGIGKFAGLFSAGFMELTTRSGGVKTTISISKTLLLTSREDLESINLPMSSSACGVDEHGTTVRLGDLNQNLSFPDPLVLKRILFLEYGNRDDFNIVVNGEKLNMEALQGETVSEETELNDVGTVSISFTIAHQPIPALKGIALRVNGKIIGKPHFFGLESSDEIQPRLLNYVTGEVSADGLEEAVTSDWAHIIENSKAWQKLEAFVRFRLLKALKARQKAEIAVAQAQWKREINKMIEKLPPHKRPFASRALDKVLKKFYDQKEENIRSVINVIVDLLDEANIRA